MARAPCCQACVAYLNRECHRHAPARVDKQDKRQFVHWAGTEPMSGCAAGAYTLDPGKLRLTFCGDCDNWTPVVNIPEIRWGRSVEWWQEAGECRCNAAVPSDEKKFSFPRVLHRLEGACCDGVLRPPEAIGGEAPGQPRLDPAL